MKCAVEWCTSDAVDVIWISVACPLIDDSTYEAVLAAGRCPMHTEQLFGIAITRQGKALLGPTFRPVDGTIDVKTRR